MRIKAGNVKSAALMGILLVVILGAAFFFILGDARAVQIKRVQSGNVGFDPDDTLTTVDLATNVTNMSRTMILLYPRGINLTVGRDQNFLFTALFEDKGTILI